MGTARIKSTNFEFRFDIGDFAITATRERMSERWFEVRLDAWAESASEVPRVSCGFSAYAERSESTWHIVQGVIERLRRMAPAPAVAIWEQQFKADEFADALQQWLFFHFGQVANEDHINPAVLQMIEDLSPYSKS